MIDILSRRAVRLLSGCEGKSRFESSAMARFVAQRSAGRNADKIVSYKCRYCGGWHVGSKLGNKDPRGNNSSALKAVKAKKLPRFANVFCSQCGEEFGPGENGFSHCANHSGISKPNRDAK